MDSEIEVSFYVAATFTQIPPVVSGLNTVIIGCFDITLITGAYITENSINDQYELGTSNIFLEEYTEGGSLLRIFVPILSASESVDLPTALHWTTDVVACSAVYTDVVTDESGATNATDPRFTEDGDQILTILTDSPFFGFIYLRAEGVIPTVFVVHKVQVTICGD